MDRKSPSPTAIVPWLVKSCSGLMTKLPPLAAAMMVPWFTTAVCAVPVLPISARAEGTSLLMMALGPIVSTELSAPPMSTPVNGLEGSAPFRSSVALSKVWLLTKSMRASPPWVRSIVPGMVPVASVTVSPFVTNSVAPSVAISSGP